MTEVGSHDQLIMAGGWGKTFTLLRITKKTAEGSGRLVDLVSNLVRMGRTVRDWASDVQVKQQAFVSYWHLQFGRRKRCNDEVVDLDSLDVALSAARDYHRIVAQMLRPVSGALTIVFVPYRLLPPIGASPMRHGVPTVDLGICDKAREWRRQNYRPSVDI